MNPRTEKLRELMRSHQLTAADVAKILGRSVSTVRIWRCKNSSRIIPETALRLLELELSAKREG